LNLCHLIFTGNKGSIGYKGPSGNTEEGNLSDDKGTTGNINVLLVTKDRSYIQSKGQSQVTQFQQEIKTILVLKDRPSMVIWHQ
jgi:restriction endonuclease Mrr